MYAKKYALNPTMCACECDKNCEIDRYLKHCTCKKSIIDDLVFTCDEIIDMPETVSIDSIDKKSNI